MSRAIPGFEWDERKRAINLGRHGIDFADAIRIFDGPVTKTPAIPPSQGETRIRALGVVNGVMLHVVYAWRAARRQLISARRAGANECRAYYASFGRAG